MKWDVKLPNNVCYVKHGLQRKKVSALHAVTVFQFSTDAAFNTVV